MYHFSSTATGDQVSPEDIRCKIIPGYEGKITFSEAAEIHWPQNVTHFGPCSGYKRVKLLLKSLIIYSKNVITRIKHDLYSAAPQIRENIELRVKKLHKQVTLKKIGAWNSPIFITYLATDTWLWICLEWKIFIRLSGSTFQKTAEKLVPFCKLIMLFGVQHLPWRSQLKTN